MERQGNERKKGPWSAEEDEVLRNHVHEHGPKKWHILYSQRLLSRTAKACRARWHRLPARAMPHEEEERRVVELQADMGTQTDEHITISQPQTQNEESLPLRQGESSRSSKLVKRSFMYVEDDSEPEPLSEAGVPNKMGDLAEVEAESSLTGNNATPDHELDDLAHKFEIPDKWYQILYEQSPPPSTGDHH